VINQTTSLRRERDRGAGRGYWRGSMGEGRASSVSPT